MLYFDPCRLHTLSSPIRIFYYDHIGQLVRIVTLPNEARI